MKKLCTLLLAASFSLALFSQNDPRIARTKTPLSQVEQVTMPHLDNETLLAAELAHRAPGIAPRFAENLEVDISPATHGHWEALPNGNALWRLRIRSGGAKSLNLGFTKYVMPAGGRLILYSPDYQHIMGPFTPADNEEHEQLWTPVLPGDELVVEVQLPAHSQTALQLELKYVNHDFVGFAEMVSGSCNLDVICGAADGWAIVDAYRDIIQSVAVISTGGGTFCTGFLVNNARQDCTPYFMTAFHCGINGGAAPSLVTYWNYFNSTCRQPNSPASGGPGNGLLNDFNTGSVLRASYGNSDFTLVELDDPVSETADAFFAGWSAEDFAPTDTVIGIHHPNTDEKRISFEFQPTFIADYLGTTPNPNGNHITIPDWDIGTTEGGSSGSPLFNREKQVVGQLHGGSAFCGNDLNDSYGWFHISWEGGGSPTTRLRDWLDPDNTGIIVLDGRSQLQCSFFVAGNPANVELCAPADAVYNISVSANFASDVMLSLANLPAGLTAVFATNPVAPGGTTTLTLSNTGALAEGSYTFTLEGTDSTNSNSADLTLFAASQVPTAPTLTFPADGAGGIALSPIFTWAASPSAKYTIEIAADIDFTNILETTANLTSGSYAASISLSPLTTYFWQVKGENACGEGAWTVASTFTTGAIICAPVASVNVPVAISASGTPSVTSTLTVANAGFADDINVTNLTILHTWIGDLRVELTSPSGTTITLFANPGSGSCDGNDMQVSLDDEATATYAELNAMCNGTSPAVLGSFQPLEPLSAFNGESAAGIWTLTVYDDANADGGSLNSWGLDLCSTIPNDFSATPSGDVFESCVGGEINFTVQLGTAFNDSVGVVLTAENLPPGATATFDPNPAPPGALVGVTVNGAASAGSFSFEVVATDGLGNSGASQIQWDVLDAPAAPVAIFPAPGATGVSLNTVLSWSATGSDYYLIMSTNPNPNIQNAILITGPQQPSYALNGLLDPCTTYFWAVGASNECGFTPPGAVYSFTTLDEFIITASPVTISACSNGSAGTTLSIGDCFGASGVTLSATGVPGGAISFSQNPAPTGSDVTVTVSLTNTAVGSYTVTITGNDGSNVVTETFTLNVTGPAPSPVMVAPANAATNVNVLTFFDWNVVTGTSSYQFELATDASFTNLVADVTQTQTNYTLTSPLNVNTTYYWRVTAFNNCGGTVPAPFSFTTWPVNSVQELNGLTVRILPNPTGGRVSAVFSKTTDEKMDATLHSVNSILVKSQPVPAGSKSVEFDLSELPAGVYLLRLRSATGVLTKKIVLDK
ncbi:MAG: proprotein convertase P-domain-containing protein [Bacteroidetes bacterium]|nr:proprotein convertase P-domain-containing protein [Bacteroidota bacterium]